MGKLNKTRKKSKKTFLDIMLSKDNLTRDIVITVIFSLLLILNHMSLMHKQAREKVRFADKNVEQSKSGPNVENLDENAFIDITNWKTYVDPRYDFLIRYPENWDDPKPLIINDKDYVYQYEVDFGTTDTLNGNGNEGFTVFVSKKDSSDKDIDYADCILKDEKDDRSKKTPEDRCLLYKLKLPGKDGAGYHSYQLMGNNFEFNIIPALKEETNTFELTTKNILQFEIAANSFALDLESIENKLAERLKQQAASAKAARAALIINQYRPPSQGGHVCPDTHDNPTNSPRKQGNHVDEDCCPDPDEWPNLRCNYSSSDYGVMLKGSPPQKLLHNNYKGN